MSRVGKRPIPIPDGVSVAHERGAVSVKGPKGVLSQRIPEGIGVDIGEGQVTLRRPDDRKQSRALHGLARALLANMVRGVTEPFVKQLEIQGVGYRAEASGKKLTLQVGLSHPVEMPIPEGLSVAVDRNVIVRVEGIDRAQVGQFAADVRAIRPPEPYKGKGIRYVDERVRRKVGKSGVAAG
ncbi:MAG: 50S ribosomal protein L6 [Myxococcales bacterium]|nr:50S ribosomal protein L6 [Myxococcales bacterium]